MKKNEMATTRTLKAHIEQIEAILEEEREFRKKWLLIFGSLEFLLFLYLFYLMLSF